MPRIQFKRDVLSVVDKTVLLPGELAAAIDTGDVYVGKEDGTSQRLANENDLEDIIVDSDDDLTNPVDVDISAIGPVKLLAEKITFIDGTTFQDKYAAGEFNGLHGANGAKGDTGLPGAEGASGAPGKNLFDQIIRTQEEFKVLIASPTWLGAKSVCFVGDGGTLMFTRVSGIVIPPTVRQIQGMNNAIIHVRDYESIPSDPFVFGYNMKPTTADYCIKDLTVSCVALPASPRGIHVFENCNQLINCTGTVIAEGGSGYVFQNCTTLTNCVGTCNCKGGSYAFGNCLDLVNCTASVSVTEGNYAVTAGFSKCARLTNCTSSATSLNTATGFNECQQLANCVGTGDRRTITGLGFYKCNQLTDCIGTGTGDVTAGDVTELPRYGFGFHTCNQLTNCQGSGAYNSTSAESKGYSFMNCSYLNGCKQGNVASTTGFLGGTNTKVDTVTVVAG